MPSLPADPTLLATLVPISSRSAEHLRQIAAQAVVDDVAAGQMPFEEGVADSRGPLLTWDRVTGIGVTKIDTAPKDGVPVLRKAASASTGQ